MSITLSSEEEQKVAELVANGRFQSAEDAVHSALDDLFRAEAWTVYAKERMAAGVQDFTMGRTISGEQFRQEILGRRQLRA
jgi:Arc/MetJ-type ribon-helix-helix transcriptional regulator